MILPLLLILTEGAPEGPFGTSMTALQGCVSSEAARYAASREPADVAADAAVASCKAQRIKVHTAVLQFPKEYQKIAEGLLDSMLTEARRDAVKAIVDLRMAKGTR